MGSEKSAPEATLAFANAREADRRIAGVAAAARAARALAEAGHERIALDIGDGAPLASATLEDLRRLCRASVVIGQGEGPAPALPTAWEIVRATGKPGDGLVSRWLNRPISQRISWLLLQVPGARPVHVTALNALLALVIVPVVLLGGEAGLVAGGIMFHAASVLDGVDGEMARATFRTTAAGATMDSVVDIATNLLFVSAFSLHLALRDRDAIGWIGAWAVALSLVGGLLIARQARLGGGPIGFDLFKRSGPVRGGADLLYWAVQTLTGRDCFAFLYMVLIIVGLERLALMIYAGVGTLWILYVTAALIPLPRRFRDAA